MSWKDTSARSKNTKPDALPTSFRIQVGSFAISIVWNHRECPGEWSMSMFGVYDDIPTGVMVQTKSYDAKVIALNRAFGVFAEAKATVEIELNSLYKEGN